MRKVEIPKGNGGKRLIYVPNRKEKFALRAIVSEIARKAELAAPENVVHGFAHKRSIVTNAEQHRGHLFTLSFDLKDFFESVTEEKLRGKLSKDELALVLVDGAARQGLPTSPAVANLGATELDKAILKWRDRKKLDFIYTRYADDLTFSFDREDLAQVLLVEVKRIVGRCGFKLNERKTYLQKARQGRRIITGIAVDDELHPPRSVKRRLRAALHQGKVNQAKGLQEFCRLKPPKTDPVKQFNGEELDRLCETWQLSKLKHDKIPHKETEWIGQVLITGDPIYMLGMSTWTTGWTSCMRQPNGQYRKGVLFWCYLRGTRIACLLSDKVMSVAGIERRVMKARCLVHELRNGVKVFDRCYGDYASAEILHKELLAAGYKGISDARRTYSGENVVGHCPRIYAPYLDNLKAKLVTASACQWKGKKVRIVHL